MAKIIHKGEIITGRVTVINPSETNLNEADSLTVTLPSGLTGIIPISEIANTSDSINARHIARRFMGRTIIAKVTQLKPVELSRGEAITERLSNITVETGQELEGVVVWVNRKYAEIEYEQCLTMILPVEEYGLIRIADLGKVIRPGQTIRVEVINVNDDQITVSHKKFAVDPWPAIQKKYKVRGQYLGRAVKKIPAGIFVNLEPGLDVLASPLPSFFDVWPGDEVALEITNIEPNAGKIKGIITTLVSSVEGRTQQIV